jgi:hypothetical protein
VMYDDDGVPTVKTGVSNYRTVKLKK